MREIEDVNELFLITVLVGLAGPYVYSALGIDRSNYVLGLLYSQFVLALPTLVYIVKSKIYVKDLFRFHKIKIGSIFLIILFAFLSMPLMQVVNLISMLFATNEISGKIYGIADNMPFLLSLGVIAALPAFLEESVYRGCFFNVYSKKSPLKAIFLSALLFGLMHLNLNQFSYAFVMGMIFCLLVEGTNSIVSSMIVHFTINGTSVVMMYLSKMIFKLYRNVGMDSSMLTEDVNSLSRQSLLIGILIYSMIAVFTTALAVLVYIAIVKHEGRWEHMKAIFRHKSKEEKEQRLFSLPLLIGVVICLTLMIRSEF